MRSTWLARGNKGCEQPEQHCTQGPSTSLPQWVRSSGRADAGGGSQHEGTAVGTHTCVRRACLHGRMGAWAHGRTQCGPCKCLQAPRFRARHVVRQLASLRWQVAGRGRACKAHGRSRCIHKPLHRRAHAPAAQATACDRFPLLSCAAFSFCALAFLLWGMSPACITQRAMIMRAAAGHACHCCRVRHIPVE